MIRRGVIVRGRVQGVFFRDTAARRARDRGVSGWVRNARDGSVEAVFEGPPDAVEAMIEFCRTGPRGASVESIEITEESPEGLGDFTVR